MSRSTPEFTAATGAVWSSETPRSIRNVQSLLFVFGLLLGIGGAVLAGAGVMVAVGRVLLWLNVLVAAAGENRPPP